MKPSRRTFLHLSAAAAALRAVSPKAWAQGYPARPVRVVVPFAAGGQADVIARLIAQRLSAQLAQQFYVENAPGGRRPSPFAFRTYANYLTRPVLGGLYLSYDLALGSGALLRTTSSRILVRYGINSTNVNSTPPSAA